MTITKNQIFGELTVVWRRGRYGWTCDCTCGKRINVVEHKLVSGVRNICYPGHVKTLYSNYQHGHVMGRRPSRTYSSWNAMMARCYAPNHPFRYRYGDRGITVCERWHTFANFLEDMGVRPPGMTLGRIDHDKGYYPGNVEWQRPHGRPRKYAK